MITEYIRLYTRWSLVAPDSWQIEQSEAAINVPARVSGGGNRFLTAKTVLFGHKWRLVVDRASPVYIKLSRLYKLQLLKGNNNDYFLSFQLGGYETATYCVRHWLTAVIYRKLA